MGFGRHCDAQSHIRKARALRVLEGFALLKEETQLLIKKLSKRLLRPGIE